MAELLCDRSVQLTLSYVPRQRHTNLTDRNEHSKERPRIYSFEVSSNCISDPNNIYDANIKAKQTVDSYRAVEDPGVMLSKMTAEDVTFRQRVRFQSPQAQCSCLPISKIFLC